MAARAGGSGPVPGGDGRLRGGHAAASDAGRPGAAHRPDRSRLADRDRLPGRVRRGHAAARRLLGRQGAAPRLRPILLSPGPGVDRHRMVARPFLARPRAGVAGAFGGRPGTPDARARGGPVPGRWRSRGGWPAPGAGAGPGVGGPGGRQRVGAALRGLAGCAAGLFRGLARRVPFQRPPPGAARGSDVAGSRPPGAGRQMFGEHQRRGWPRSHSASPVARRWEWASGWEALRPTR